MYHSLKFEGIDIPLDAIERGAASSESAGLPGKVQRHSALRRLVFDEIDAAVQGQGSTYTTLQQDLAKWHTTLVSPVGQALAEGQMIWDRADGWSTFEANVAPPPPVALDSVMARFEQLLREEEHSGARAILALVGMGYVQPFAEGSDNELLGRLLMNKLLAVGGYQWVIVPWQEKEAYLAALTKACELREQGIGEFVSALLQAQSRVPGDAIARDPTAASWRERLPPPC